MDWPDILALDEAALNMAIDAHVYGYTWHPVQHGDSDRGDWWQCTEEPAVLVTRSSVPYHHHTESWERTMALAWRMQIALKPHWEDGARPVYAGWDAHLQWAIPRTHLNKGWPYQIHCTTEAEARVALCRLALWAALQRQETL